MAGQRSHIFCFGLGYCAKALGRVLLEEGWKVSGTTRSLEVMSALAEEGFETHLFDPQNGLDLPSGSLDGVSHILISTPPGEKGDPVISSAAHLLSEAAVDLQWIGYFSTTGVYGDHDGGWVDETSPVNPSSERGARRVKAEQDWQALAHSLSVPLNIFRLPGIYGPGRNALVSLQKGKARRIVKKGQFFSRIHVDDIVGTLTACIKRGGAGDIYNVVDDEPAPPQDVISYAARLLGVEPPEEIDFNRADLSPMARSFYAENKRVKNNLIKEKLGVKLIYPDYRTGLEVLFKSLS